MSIRLPNAQPASRPGLNITRLSAADAPAYRRLMLHAYEHAADAFTSTAEERAAEPHAWWARRIASADGLGVGFGAFEGGTLVGSVALEFSAKPKTRHKALVIGMYVNGSYRGQGVGRALLDAAVQCAHARAGIHVMTLTVTQGNDAALALYRAAGFEVFGTEPLAILTPTGFKAKIHMWRPVAAAGPPPTPDLP